MIEEKRIERNQERLTELYPTFAKKISKLITALESLGLRPRIQDAWRSPEKQLEAFNKGNSKLKFGFHNVTGANGKKESLAVDLLDDNSPTSPGSKYLLILAAEAEKLGMTTGIRWGLPTKLREAIDKAISDKDWNAHIKIGWDPTHVQPTTLTVEQARQGMRPD